jgi:UDP-2,3-diacylglucosamine pyrophosphatase LpxH
MSGIGSQLEPAVDVTVADARPPLLPEAGWDLLLLSDIHLGSDLRRSELHRRGSLEAIFQRSSLDKALGSLLDHYARNPPEGKRWRLVLAGDIIDFIGVNLTPKDVGDTVAFSVTPDEELHGLEPSAERCAWMMSLVLRRHPYFFERLASFIAAGNDVVIVRGNHDAALFWHEVQENLRTGIAAAATRLGLTPAAADAVAGCVSFEDWFYLEPGRIYVEHGHLHDSYSSDPNARSTDFQRPDRLSQPISTLMVRYFGNRFSTLDLDNVDRWTAWDYVRWAFVLENPFVVFAVWVKTVSLLLWPFLRRTLRKVRRARFRARATQEIDPEEEITGEVEIASRIQAKLAKGVAEAERFAFGLARLVRRAASVSAVGVLRAFFLDRAAAVAGGVAVSLGCVAIPMQWSFKSVLAVVAIGIAIRLERRFAAAREVSISPKLHAAAEALSRLIEVPLVVMGHSHKPTDTVLQDGRTRYVNLGSWVSASKADKETDAGCPHLVIRANRAEFIRGRVADLVSPSTISA